MAKKLRRKDLKQPDEFVTRTEQALRYVRENERQVLLATIGVVGLAGIALGVRAYRDWQTTSARESFAIAQQRYTAGSFAEAATAFQEVRSKWPNTSAGQMAGVYAGNALIELGKRDEAREEFRAAAASVPEDTLRQIALYNLGVLSLEAGDPDDAERQLHLASEIEGPLRGAAWLAARGGAAIAEGEEAPEGVPTDVRELLRQGR